MTRRRSASPCAEHNALTELDARPERRRRVLSLAPQAIGAERAGDLVTLLRNDGLTGRL
jgi:hypothetical protein